MEEIRLIDVDSEDDCLIDSSSPPTDIGTLSASLLDDVDQENILQWSDGRRYHEETSQDLFNSCSPLTAESSASGKVKEGHKYNLRESLVWDSAFFTNEGMLNSEELRLMNKGFSKPDPYKFYEGSVDSEGLKNEEHLTLRTSQPGLSAETGDANPIDGVNSKKDPLVNTMAMQSSTSKSRIIMRHGSGRVSKDSTCACETSQNINDRKTSAKPPKIVSTIKKASPLGTTGKMSTLNSGSFKRPPEKDVPAAKSGHLRFAAISQSRNSSVSSSPASMPKQTKGPSRMSPVSDKAAVSTYSGSSLERSDSNSSTFSVSSHETLACASSGSSANKLRKNIRGKTESRSSSLSAYVKANSKFATNISPLSSIDGMSSESSSSNCHDKKSLFSEANSCSSSLETVPTNTCQSENAEALRSVQRSSGTFVFSSSSALPSSEHKACATINISKPSSLWKPSPKIGFFDVTKNSGGQKTSFATASQIGSVQNSEIAGFHSALPRNAPSRATITSIKPKIHKHQLASASQIGSMRSSINTSSPANSSIRPLGPKPQSTRASSFFTGMQDQGIAVSKIKKPLSVRSNKKDSAVYPLKVAIGANVSDGCVQSSENLNNLSDLSDAVLVDSSFNISSSHLDLPKGDGHLCSDSVSGPENCETIALPFLETNASSPEELNEQTGTNSISDLHSSGDAFHDPSQQAQIDNLEDLMKNMDLGFHTDTITTTT